MIMADDAMIEGQYTDLIQRFTAPFGMRVIIAELPIARGVKPVAFSADIDTGLIAMDQIGCCQLISYPEFKGF